MNRNNNKSTGKVVLLKVPQQQKQSRSVAQLSKAKNNNTRGFEYKSIQPKSRKSQTGAAYNDGFDVVNQPVKPKVRYEDFDEICYSLAGSVNFGLSRIPLNPAQATHFPRISNFAKLYDRYKFTKLEVYFQHDVSQFALNGSKGLVVLSCNYDAASAVPSSKQEMEMTNPHVIGMPNQNILLKLDHERLHPKGYPLFTRPGVKPGGTDIKTYDCGIVSVATQGTYDGTEIGEIHIRGTVAFYDEIIVGPQINPPSQDSLSEYLSNGGQTLTSNLSSILALAVDVTNPLEITRAGSQFIPPPGNYLMMITSLFYNTASALSQTKITFSKNGSQIGIPSVTYNAGTSNTMLTQNSQKYVECNGTDYIEVIGFALFASGTTTVESMIEFISC